MKKKLIIILLILVVILAWVIYSYTRPAILVGKSEDGNWIAEYAPETFLSTKDIWNGHAIWKGKDSISSVTLIEFRTADSVLTSNDVEKVNIKSGDVLEFVSIGNKPNNDSHVLYIEWVEDGVSKNETIHFQEKKRFFVLPFFLFLNKGFNQPKAQYIR